MNAHSLLETAARAANAAVGTEWLIDAGGCDPDALRDLDVMRRLCGRILTQLDLRVIGHGMWHQFPGDAGVTGLFLLTESHLACHTYPENGTATFNLYCCRSRPRWAWEPELRAELGATHVAVRAVARGDPKQSPQGEESQP